MEQEDANPFNMEHRGMVEHKTCLTKAKPLNLGKSSFKIGNNGKSLIWGFLIGK